MESLKRLVEKVMNHKGWVTHLTLGTVIACSVFGVIATTVIASKVTRPVGGETVYISENLDTVFQTTTAVSTTETTQATTIVTTTCTTQTTTETTTTESTTTATIVTSTSTETTMTETTTEIVETENFETTFDEKNISGPSPNHLTKHSGVSKAPNGFDETYYDLDMSGVVRRMRKLGFSE